MISLKKYLDSSLSAAAVEDDGTILAEALKAYSSALSEMGSCSAEVCPALGDGLKQRLGSLQAELSLAMNPEALAATDREVREQLAEWGRQTSRHFREKAGEVKELLLTMARTGESVGARDQRYVKNMDEVTNRLKAIASLDDLAEVRSSIQKSAEEIKTSMDRMAAEGKAVLDELRKQVSAYQTKLEEAEELATRDLLTRLRSRMGVENLIESRIALGKPFCLVMVDINEFKSVNDNHGHLAGDELLKQFASELRSACHSTDGVGRWGGDEFVILLDCGRAEASERIERLKKWVCGNYTIQGPKGTMRLKIEASFGLAEHIKGEEMNTLLARADRAMYEHKGTSRGDVHRM